MLPVHTIEERRKSCFLLKDFVNCWSANNTREAKSLACESFKIRAFYCFLFFLNLHSLRTSNLEEQSHSQPLKQSVAFLFSVIRLVSQTLSHVACALVKPGSSLYCVLKRPKENVWMIILPLHLMTSYDQL